MDIIFAEFIYYRGKTPSGNKRLCRYSESHVITNYVITNKRQKMYINDAELAGTTTFLCYSEVYVISRLVISRDDLYW